MPSEFDSLQFEMVETPLQILVVEDNEDSRDLLGEMLRVLGHEAHCVSNAESAIQCFDGLRIDVLLADISLPGMSGIELAASLTARTPALRVIFASGFGYLIADRMEFDFILLPKPYSLLQLEHALDAACQLRSAARRP
jgi:CheY-like chemotaxis protein